MPAASGRSARRRSVAAALLLATVAAACSKGGATDDTSLAVAVEALRRAEAADAKIAELQRHLGLPAGAAADGHGAADLGHGAAADAGRGADAGHGDGEALPRAGEHAPEVHWSYGGEDGPEHWAELSDSFKACAEGAEQSPVDLTRVTPSLLPDLEIATQPTHAEVVHNGHTVQVNVALAGALRLDGVFYDLAQFHAHGPSEHQVDGVVYPLELHFVHKSADGGLAVLGMLVEEGPSNPAFDSVIEALPDHEGETKEVHGDIDPAGMLPPSRVTYRYPGSLTTPPCTEGVHWNVFAAPVSMSGEQIAAFTSRFHEPNNRPVMPVNERRIVLDIG